MSQWTEISQVPSMLARVGLGETPLKLGSHWYVRQGGKVLRAPGVGAGLGDVASLQAAAQAASDAIDADPSYCANVSINGSTVNTAVHAFKVAWNADASANGEPTLAYNGLYDSDCASALANALGGMNGTLATVPGPCAGGGGGGGGPAPTPSPTPSPAPITPVAGSSTNWAPWIIGGAVVAAGGVVGYAVWRRHKRKR